jgi:hypothetical protein
VRHGVPAIYAFREFAEVGGLMSYGTSNTDRDRQVGVAQICGIEEAPAKRSFRPGQSLGNGQLET